MTRTDAATEVPKELPAEMSDDEEEAEREAKLLGLHAGPQEKKRKSTENNGERAKKKRTKEEMYDEEVDKVQASLATLIGSLSQWPKTPTGYELGKVDRLVSGRLKSMQENSAFDCVSRLQVFSQQVKCVRECMKAAQTYLPAKGLPKKQHLSAFYDAFAKAQKEVPTVFNAFPATVRCHYQDAAFSKQIEIHDWQSVAASLSMENLVSLYGEEDDNVEKMATQMIEQALRAIMDMDPSDNEFAFVSTTLTKTCQSMIDAKCPSSLSDKLQLLIQVVAMDSQGLIHWMNFSPPFMNSHLSPSSGCSLRASMARRFGSRPRP